MDLIPRRPLSELIQNIVHKLDEGIGARVFRVLTLVLAMVGLGLLYNSCAYRNISTPEGMDAAQLARNLAEHKGYTTQFIRPLSLYLVEKRDQTHGRAFSVNGAPDYARIKSPHPDIANPPVYPVVLAVLMKVLPFHYAVETKKPFWTENGSFARYEPDFLIAMFNECLLLVAVVMTFFIARKLFDPTVAWLSAILMIGCELLWRFSASGLSTILLMVFFLALVWCLLKIEEHAREPQPRIRILLGLVIFAGFLTGAGVLTRYAFGWAIVPVVLFLALFSGPHRLRLALVALGVFAIVLAPWVIRNWTVCGQPFGTATFAATESTRYYPAFRLERSIHPDLFPAHQKMPYLQKFLANLRDTLNNEVPKLGGSWTSVLFIAGLFLGFRNPAPRRMRYFLLLCLGTLIVVQSLGRTQLSVETPELNSENLLVLLAPLVFVYSTAIFFTLLDQMTLSALLPMIIWRYLIMGVLVIVACVPMIFVLLPPKTSPVVYPPYYPPELQRIAAWQNENELMMSDVPWAVAWYGNRQCIWLSLNAQDDFFAVNDYLKPVSALYLTTETMDGRFVTDWIRTGELSWGSFAIEAVVQNQIPPRFPLRFAPGGFLPSRLYLTDRERWKLATQ
jgi:hypothetical protein